MWTENDITMNNFKKMSEFLYIYICVCVHTYDEWSCAPRKFRAEQLFKRTFISSLEINKKNIKKTEKWPSMRFN